MGINPTINYFGRVPTTIVLRSSTDFDGAANTGALEIDPGLYIFAAASGGGLYDFHDDIIQVKQIFYTGGGTLTVSKVIKNAAGSTVQTTTIVQLTAGSPNFLTEITLAPQEYLTFSTSGATNPVVSITAHLAEFVSDGAA